MTWVLVSRVGMALTASSTASLLSISSSPTHESDCVVEDASPHRQTFKSTGHSNYILALTKSCSLGREVSVGCKIKQFGFRKL